MIGGLNETLINLRDILGGVIMRIKLQGFVDIKNVLRYDVGIKPKYGRKGSTDRGIVRCQCSRCIGTLILKDNEVTGWFEPECECGTKIDWSEANAKL